jgi:hypothetical protein
VAFTNVSSVEILQLAAGTNSVTLGVEAEQAGITTVTGNTGADTLNLLYGTAGLTFNAGNGSDTLSYSADSTAQAVTLSSIASNVASGSVVNNGTDSFTGLEAIVGGSGTADSITSTSAGEALIVTGANAGTIDGFSFSGVESVNLGDGNDTGTINTGGSLSGSLSFGSGTSDSLSYAGYGSAVSVTLDSISSNAGTTTSAGATAIGGIASGFESLTGSSNSDSLVASSAGNTLILTGANQGTVDGLSFSSFESVDLGGGNDSAQFTSGDSLSGILAGGGGTDTLDYSSYGSAVTVNLATGAATGTGGISGFETVLGTSAADTLTASTSGDVNLQGNAGADTFNFTVAGLTSTDTVDGGDATDTLVVTDAGTLTDAQFTNVTTVESVTLTGASTLTAGTEASQAGIATVTIGSGATTVNTSLAGYDLTIDAANLGDGASLTLTGNASSNDFTVNNLVGSVLASGTSGSLTVSAGNATDNGISITTGTANTTTDASGSGDTITVNADAMADNSTLDINGSSTFTVSNLEANTDAAGTSGTVSLAYTDVADNAATITTGSGATTVSGDTSGDTLTINAASLANNTALIESGAAQQVVNNLVGDISASALTGTLTVTTGDNTNDNTISITTGTANTTITASGSGDTITVNADAMADNTTLDINGSSTFTVSNLEANTDAAGTSGTVSLAYTDVADNAATITTGTGATTLSGTTAGDTLTINAASLANNTALTESGAAQQVVNNLVGDISASALTGTLTVTTGDNTNDNTISITTGTANTTITASGSGDTITLNADAMADNTTLDINGSSTFTVSNLEANTDAAGISGPLTLAYSNVTDNAATLLTGSGNVVVNGGDSSDTITVTGLSTSNQTFNAQASTSNFNITAGANNQTITGSNTGNDTINGGTGTDTLSYAGGSNVAVTITSYSTQAGGSTGQGTDSFSNIESLVGASGTDTLRGTTATTDEVVTVTGANTGTIRDSATTGTFSFSSFEQLDLQGGNDSVVFNNNAASIASNLDLGGGTSDTLSYSGTTNAVSVTLTDITSTTGSTAAGGATAISGTATGFENLIGGSNTGDTITDSTGNSTVAITGANSGTIDGLAFSSIENLNLSTGNDTVTVTGSGSGISLTGSLNLGDDTNSLTMSSSAGSIGSVTSGTGEDTFSISAGSVIGAVNAGDGLNTLTISNTNSSIGSYIGGTGTDSITLSGGDVVGDVSTSTGNDTVLISSTSSTIGGNLDLGTGDSDTLSYAGYTNAVSVTLTAITSNSGSTAGGGATAISGTATGFENLIGGSNTGDTVTDSTGNSTIVISGANSGTIDGMAFSAIENLSLSDGIDGVTVQTDGSLSGNLNLGDGTSNTLVMNSGAGAIGSVTASGGNDTFTINGGTVTGAVTAGDGTNQLTINNTASTIGSYTGGSGVDTIDSKGGDILGSVDTGSAADSVTLTLDATITGTVTLGGDSDAYDGNDTLTFAAGISSATTITGNVSFGNGTGDKISYSGNNGPITVALDSISADSVGTATGAKASYITGNVTGFEAIVGSNYNSPTSDSVTGDTIYDNTSASLVVLTGANTGTIDNLDFSSIENLQLRSGADTLSFQGTSGAPGLIAGRADGGGIEGASYTNGVYSGGTKTDDAIDLLDYTSYQASSGASVDLSQNKATGVYGGLAGGLINGDGSIANETTNSSFENVDGSRFNDTITGDAQTNVLRGFDGADTIKGLAGNDTIDGGDGIGSNSTDGADSIEGGLGADTIIGSFGNDTISGGSFASESDDSIDTLTYSATSISTARIEGLDISLTGTDKGTVLGDANNSSFSVSTFTNTYNSAFNQQLITVPTNQASNDWSQTYSDIQNLILSNQNDIVRLDVTDITTGSIDAGTGSLDTLDYSTFNSSSPVLVNLSGAAYSFDFDANGTIDTTLGEITITNAYSATNVKVTAASSQGGANGVSNFEVVIGGAADDAIVGNASNNLLVGNAGNDRIAGGAGNDTIYSGTGDDYIIPGADSDYVNAGAGINTIAITSSDLAQDTFAVDPNGINIFELQGNGTDKTSITAPTGNWNPGTQGIDLLDGGDPVVNSGGVTVYDTINGSSSADSYEFGSVAFKNIGNVDLGVGNDSLGTAATTKGVKVNYDGGSGNDSVTLNLTYFQFANLNASGLYVANVQNYLDNPSGKTFSSSQADFTASNFETGGVAVITPGVYNALQGDPAANTFNSAYGVRSTTITSGDDINLAASALTTSTATALSVPDIVSAFVQASGVKGSDAITVSSGGNTTGSTTASQDASAISRTVDDRADSVLAAYALGTDRSSFTAGDNITLGLSGNVKADSTAESLGFVVNASGTVESAGSRDSSLTAGAALNLNISGTAAQTVAASNVDGLANAALASRTYGIDDANLTDAATDSVQAGSDLSLQATASSSSLRNVINHHKPCSINGC